MTDAPKTIWVDLDPEYDSLVVYPEPHCDLSGVEGYAQYTLTSHAEAEKREAVNAALGRAYQKAMVFHSKAVERAETLNDGQEDIHEEAACTAGSIAHFIRKMKEEQ